MHLHDVRDADSHFIIDPITRAITNSTSAKNTLMMGDHNSEIFTFEIPKAIEGHDMTLCNTVEIHFIDISADKSSKSADVYIVNDMQIAEDADDTLVFSWLISDNATKYTGLLNFRIRFACIDENGNYTYKWHTDIYKGIAISDGFDNTAAVVEEYSDILAAWESRLDALEQGGGAGPVARIGYVELLAANWKGEETPFSQVVNIEGVTANSQVDLTPSVEQLAIFYNKDLAFVTENNNGVVTVYAIGQKPANDYTIQVTMTEVSK